MMTREIRHSVQQKIAEFFQQKNLEEQCTRKSLSKLRTAFMLIENKEMNETQLQSAFKKILEINLSEDDFKKLFRKINVKRNGVITWDELISYILLECEKKNLTSQWKTIELPLADYPQILKSRHRSSICRIAFYFECLPDRTSSFSRGCYLTVSKDGLINYWSLDLKYKHSVKSINSNLKVNSTLITDMIVLSDIQMICTSSAECDLRFYDTAAAKFDFQKLIYGFESAIMKMSYSFSTDLKENSYIILGDKDGNIKVMSFSPIDKGPFKHLHGQDVLCISYKNVLKGKFKGLTVKELKNIHNNWIAQVGYYRSIRAFISCAECYKCSLLISNPSDININYKFSVTKGISCFDFCEKSRTLVTGGPDCIIRTWHPFIPKKANRILYGHKIRICALIMSKSGQRLYSLSMDRSLKIWDLPTQICIQTYNRIPNDLSLPVSLLYNDMTHKIIIASSSIIVLNCEQVVDQQISDGYTHTKPVTCVLYNDLFKVIVSVGLDSCIIVWDPWFGRRLHLVTNAHTELRSGEQISIEITAACFDYSRQLLITGARNGSLKIWNFMMDTCLRNMKIDKNCYITDIIWLKNKILCGGWNRHITEFADSIDSENKKNWAIKHSDDILCIAGHLKVLVTASYNGEIVFWRLESGQPYKTYQVNNPTEKMHSLRQCGMMVDARRRNGEMSVVKIVIVVTWTNSGQYVDST